MNIKMTSFVPTFWQRLRTFGLHKVQCHKNKPESFFVLWKQRAKVGRLTQTRTSIPPGCSTVTLYNVVQLGMCRS